MGEQKGLEKTLGYKAILLITINSIMGTGIFFLPAVGAKYAGPSSLIAWALMAVIAIYTSMCFAELTSMFPKSGGIYEFAKQAYGRTISFFIGWTTLIAGYITIAMLVIGAIQYIFPAENVYWIIAIASIFIVVWVVLVLDLLCHGWSVSLMGAIVGDNKHNEGFAGEDAFCRSFV